MPTTDSARVCGLQAFLAIFRTAVTG